MKVLQEDLGVRRGREDLRMSGIVDETYRIVNKGNRISRRATEYTQSEREG